MRPRDHVSSLMRTEAYRSSEHERKKIETRFGDVERNLGLARVRLRGLTGARDELPQEESGQPRPDTAPLVHGRLSLGAPLD